MHQNSPQVSTWEIVTLHVQSLNVHICGTMLTWDHSITTEMESQLKKCQE